MRSLTTCQARAHRRQPRNVPVPPLDCSTKPEPVSEAGAGLFSSPLGNSFVRLRGISTTIIGVVKVEAFEKIDIHIHMSLATAEEDRRVP